MDAGGAMSGAKDLLAEVRYNGKMMKVVDVLDAINALSPATLLTTSEAAVFLRTSVTKMERLRKDGDGPPYIQGGGLKAKGSNQTCLYEKADLLTWVKRSKVSSSLEAAIRKGQTFTTIFDLVEQHAFYLDKNGSVESTVEENLLGTVVERIGDWEIIWLTAIAAASRRWSDLSRHQEFAANVKSVLSNALQSVQSGIEATDIASVLREHAGRSTKLVD
jgi:hypothetical protein